MISRKRGEQLVVSARAAVDAAVRAGMGGADYRTAAGVEFCIGLCRENRTLGMFCVTVGDEKVVCASKRQFEDDLELLDAGAEWAATEAVEMMVRAYESTLHDLKQMSENAHGAVYDPDAAQAPLTFGKVPKKMAAFVGGPFAGQLRPVLLKDSRPPKRVILPVMGATIEKHLYVLREQVGEHPMAATYCYYGRINDDAPASFEPD